MVADKFKFKRFRWVALQLAALQDCRNANDIAGMLKSLPKTLDAMYDQILAKISEGDQKYAVKVLQFLAFAARSVTLKEVAHIVAINVDSNSIDQGLDDAQDIVDICTSLVTLSSSGEFRVKKMRSSIKNTNRSAQSGSFHCQGVLDLPTHDTQFTIWFE
jgi:DNA polymerase III delta prime subunit